MGAHPSVDLFDQSGLIDDAGYDAQVVNILHFYTWSIRCFVHAPQNTSPAKRTCGMWENRLNKRNFRTHQYELERAQANS
jgi:starvation-inducible outer membrane lipoprotein